MKTLLFISIFTFFGCGTDDIAALLEQEKNQAPKESLQENPETEETTEVIEEKPEIADFKTVADFLDAVLDSENWVVYSLQKGLYFPIKIDEESRYVTISITESGYDLEETLDNKTGDFSCFIEFIEYTNKINQHNIGSEPCGDFTLENLSPLVFVDRERYYSSDF